MRIRTCLLLITALLLLPILSEAQKGHSSSSRSSRSSTTHASSKSKNSSAKVSKSSASGKTTRSIPRKSSVASRAANGKILRSAAVRKEFMKQTGYARGRKGYVVDHVVPLECGGADVPSNMQWQTVHDAKIKDRTERNCRKESCIHVLLRFLAAFAYRLPSPRCANRPCVFWVFKFPVTRLYVHLLCGWMSAFL